MKHERIINAAVEKTVATFAAKERERRRRNLRIKHIVWGSFALVAVAANVIYFLI